MTRTPLSRSKRQRSRSPGCFTRLRVGASGSSGRWECVGCEKLLLRCCLLGRARRFGAYVGRSGAGADFVAAARLELVIITTITGHVE